MVLLNLIDYRKKVISNINTHLNNIEKSIEIETAILEYTKNKIEKYNWNSVKVRRTYLWKYRSILYNISSSEYVRNMILTDECDATRLINMKPDELCPEKWKDIKHKQYVKENCKSNYEGLFKCEKCNGKNTSYYQLQTRSSDEPMTTYIKCLNCDYTWSENN